MITPALYASCFLRLVATRFDGVRDMSKIKLSWALSGRGMQKRKDPGNPRGDWIQYFRDILERLGNNVDGISLHTYTHGPDPALISSGEKMQPPFQNYHYHFRAYRDFMAAIPPLLRDRPVYVTETDQYGAWRNRNSGWIQSAYREIHNWNQDPYNQPIQALILFRWIIGNPNDPRQVGWAVQNKAGVQNDFRNAMNHAYRLVLPRNRPEYLVEWLRVNAPSRMDPGSEVIIDVALRNAGRRAWAHTGAQAVRLGTRWLDVTSHAIAGWRTDLPRVIFAGQSVTIPAARIKAPTLPGAYTLEFDLVEGTSGWFAQQGSPTWKASTVQVGARYRVAWLRIDAPQSANATDTLSIPVRLRNEGSLTWSSDSEHPVLLTYKWLDASRNVVVADGLRTALGRAVAPLEEILLNARVQMPAESGQYILQFDMVHEFVTWFQWKDSPVFEVNVEARPATLDIAAQWLVAVVPQTLGAGETGSAYLQVKNIGSSTWPQTGDQDLQLGYRWFDAQEQELVLANVETWPMPGKIEPGKVATFRNLLFATPATPGSYRLVWDLKQNRIWLSTRGVAVVEMPVKVLAPDYGVAWRALDEWPNQMPPDQELSVNWLLSNVGARAWSASGEHPVHLVYSWFTGNGTPSEPWDTFRTRLPQDVPAGGDVKLLGVPFKTPPVLGDYVLRWDLVEEGNTWFFRQGADPWEVAVAITDRTRSLPWTARSSDNESQVALAFDGKTETFWDSRSSQKAGMWLQVDLEQELVLDRVKAISPGRGFPSGFKIKLSTDGQDWHLVAKRDRNWSNIDEAFAPCRARFIHLELIGQANSPATWMISEIAVSTTDPWSGATASHYSDDAYKAWDARLGTYWNTRAVKQRPGMWFQVDMGTLRDIERVTLDHPGNQMPRGYLVQVSADDQHWQEVGRKDDNWGQVDVAFPSTEARYVRVETANSSPYQPWGISEFVVWCSNPIWIHGW